MSDEQRPQPPKPTVRVKGTSLVGIVKAVSNGVASCHLWREGVPNGAEYDGVLYCADELEPYRE